MKKIINYLQAIVGVVLTICLAWYVLKDIGFKWVPTLELIQKYSIVFVTTFIGFILLKEVKFFQHKINKDNWKYLWWSLATLIFTFTYTGFGLWRDVLDQIPLQEEQMIKLTKWLLFGFVFVSGVNHQRYIILTSLIAAAFCIILKQDENYLRRLWQFNVAGCAGLAFSFLINYNWSDYIPERKPKLQKAPIEEGKE